MYVPLLFSCLSGRPSCIFKCRSALGDAVPKDQTVGEHGIEDSRQICKSGLELTHPGGSRAVHAVEEDEMVEVQVAEALKHGLGAEQIKGGHLCGADHD